MPTIRILDLGARVGLRNQRTDERALYREALAKLSGDGTLESIPDDGETLRKLKLATNRTSTEIGRDVRYGETEEGTLRVWLAHPTRRRRGERHQ